MRYMICRLIMIAGNNSSKLGICLENQNERELITDKLDPVKRATAPHHDRNLFLKHTIMRVLFLKARGFY